METRHRMPLQDLSLERFLTPGIVPGSKAPRNHKRPLSPSRTIPFNPAKRRVLDAEGISSSNSHTVTPTRLSRLGNGPARNHGSPQGTSSHSLSHHCSPSREIYPKPTVESSADPQSRHYPGFDIFWDSEHRRVSPVPRVPLLPDGDAQIDGSEEDKENVPLGRKAKKNCSHKRFLSGLDSDAPYLGAHAQASKVVHLTRSPFSACQAPR